MDKQKNQTQKDIGIHKVPEELEGRHAQVYKTKLSQMHEGACSSPGKSDCPCTNNCPLHGRCCDCIRHHLAHDDIKEREDLLWLPACIKDAMGIEY